MIDSAEKFDPAPAFYGVAAALWVVGFLCALMPLPVFEAETFFIAVLSVFSAAFFVLAVFPVSALGGLMRKPVMVLALAFWLLAAVSVAFSEVPFVAVIYFCFFSVFPISFFTAVFSADRARFLKWVLAALAVIMGALSVSCLVQYFFFPAMLFSGSSVAWPLANPNSLAGVLVFGFMGGLGLMIGGKNRVHSNIGLALAALVFAALLTTGSRGAMLAMIPALAVLFVFARGALVHHKRCLGALAVMAVIAFALLSLGAPGLKSSPLWDYTSTVAGEQSFLFNRPALWTSALEIFKAHPFTGTGVGTFFLYYPEVRTMDDPSSAGLMAHSDPLQFASEMGALAPLLFYAFLLVCLVRTVKAVKALPKDDMARMRILVSFCALAAVVVHAHITFHFHVLSLLMLMGLCLGYWYVQTARALGEENAQDEDPHQSPAIRFGLAGVLILMLGVFAPFQASEILVSRAQSSLAAGALNQSVDQVNRAGRLSHNMNARALLMAANFPLGVLQLNAPLMKKQDLVDMTMQVEGLLDQAWVVNPRLAHTLYHRAELLAYTDPFLPKDVQRGADGAMPYYLRQALALDPLHISSRLKLADLHLRKRERAEAMEILKAGMGWQYYNQNPRHYLEKIINLAREMGDAETAARAEAALARYMPVKSAP